MISAVQSTNTSGETHDRSVYSQEESLGACDVTATVVTGLLESDVTAAELSEVTPAGFSDVVAVGVSEVTAAGLTDFTAVGLSEVTAAGFSDAVRLRDVTA